MINMAYAQEVAGAAAGSSVSGTLVQLIVIFAIFYFILIRPQQKQIKLHQQMLAALVKGDKVITAGGIVAKVVSLTEDELEVEISKDTVVKIKRSTVKEVVLPQATNDNKKETKKKAKK
ncbi:MAG: preprotein translocase subunit YajC [Alphaproteobacteria bacterium]